MEPAIRFADPVMVIGHWHNVEIVDLGGRITLAHVRAIRMNHSLLVTRFPAQVTGFNIIRATVPMSDKPVHDELSKMMKDFRESGVAMSAATLHEGKGIVGSTARTVMRTIMTLTGNRQQRIVSNMEDGVAAILPFARTAEGDAVTSFALEQVIMKVRAVYDKQLAAEPAQHHT